MDDFSKPVIINTGRLYVQYLFEPHHTTFVEGLSIVEDNDPKTWDLLLSVARSFSLERAFSENGIQRPIDETREDLRTMLKH
ncbi:MAG: hypothetical protein PHE68_06170 [Candidatus Peribacteraceae bacterium]|nr:hypothetical protein [Candidatus Peribacteraceae bacterium]MDD5074763.1 hypothetical protein [Candidatus Peribacteraceae bacterium]